MSSPVSELFEAVAAATPEREAFCFRTFSGRWRRWTYAQVAQRVQTRSQGLLSLGLRPGTRAVVLYPPSPDFFCLLLAMLSVGIVPVLADPRAGWRRLGEGLKATGAQAFIAPRLFQWVARLLGWTSPAIQRWLTPRVISQAGDRSPGETAPRRSLDDEAAIVFTSGSTGPAKAVILTQNNLVAQAELARQILAPGAPEKDLPTLPLFALLDLLLGLTAVLPFPGFPAPARIPAGELLRTLETHRIDTLFASPILLKALVAATKNSRRGFSSLRTLITAGAPAPATVQRGARERLGTGSRLLGVYGSTESLLVTCSDLSRTQVDTLGATHGGGGLCLGRPLQRVGVRILSLESQTEVGIGVRGEICVDGASVSLAYAGVIDQSFAKLSTERGPAHRMGDAGYFDASGQLWFCGRVAHSVETEGGRLFSEEFEGIFNDRDGLGRTALTGQTTQEGVRPLLWVENPLPWRRRKLRAAALTLASQHPMTRELSAIRFLRRFPSDARHNSKILRERLRR